MPKISETLRGLPSQFSAQAQSVGQKLAQPVQTVKTGFLGDNGKFETSDLKPIADNIRQYGLTGGLAKTLFGYFKPDPVQPTTPTTTGGQLPQFNFGTESSQYDPYNPFGTQQSSPFNFGYGMTQPTTSTDQYQGFTRYNPFAPTQYDMSGMMQMINAPIANMFQAPASSQGFEPYRPPIPKTGETTVFDFVNNIEATSDSGLQMASEGDQQQAPAPTAPKITPSKMPASDFDYKSAPAMTIADMNRLKSQIEFSNYFTNPASRQVGYTSIAQRFNPLAGHEAFIRQMDMAKYAGDLNPSLSLEDAEYQQEMARKLASMYQ